MNERAKITSDICFTRNTTFGRQAFILWYENITYKKSQKQDTKHWSLLICNEAQDSMIQRVLKRHPCYQFLIAVFYEVDPIESMV